MRESQLDMEPRLVYELDQKESYLNEILDRIEEKILSSSHWGGSEGEWETDRMTAPTGLFNDNRSSESIVIRPRVMSTPEPEPETVTIKLKPKRKKKKSRKEIKRNRKATRLARKWGRRKRSKRK